MAPPYLLFILLVVPILFALFTMLATLHYRITGTDLEVLTLGRRVRRIDLDDIEEVHRRGALLRESWVGPKFWNVVIVRRRSGLLKNLAISPDDPERFVARLVEAMARRTAERRDYAAGGRGPAGSPGSA